jgi:hypothetical protein
MILNENDSREMPTLQLTVNRKRHKRITASKFSMFQSAFIGNIASSNIYGGRDTFI